MIEFKKVYYSKQLLLILTLLMLSLVIPSLALYFFGYNSTSYMYFYESIALNNKMVFPLIYSVFFSWLIASEYRQKTIRLLYHSKYSIEKVFFSKVIVGFISMTIILFILFVVSVLFILLYDNDQISIHYYVVNEWDYLLRIIITFLSISNYLFTFSLIVILFTILLRKQSLSILLSVVLILLYPVLSFNIPSHLIDLSPLRGLSIHTILITYNLKPLELIQFNLSCIAFSIILIFINLRLYRKCKVV
ncbi:ABC transporter permease [Paraliobacillus sp. PM-2]|uniref:ABC transporter permease n=1 Tax=Paraliobacillus sp. PM-2 TaxID=1462524 RepID=UPI00350E41AB